MLRNEHQLAVPIDAHVNADDAKCDVVSGGAIEANASLEISRMLERLANDPNVTSEDIAASFSVILDRSDEQRTRARMLGTPHHIESGV